MAITTMGGTYFVDGKAFKTLPEAQAYETLKVTQQLNNAPKVVANPNIPTVAPTAKPVPVATPQGPVAPTAPNTPVMAKPTPAAVKPTTTAAPAGTGLLDRLTSKEGLGTIGSLLLSMSGNQNLAQMGATNLQQAQARKAQQVELQKSAELRNRTIEELNRRGRSDLADAIKSGLLDAPSAAKLLFAKPEDSTPAAFKALEMRAQAAGLKPGSPEYADFMVRGGAQSGMALSIGPDGQVQFTTGGAAPLKLTESQGKATGFFGRAQASNQTITSLENAGTDFAQAIMGQVPLAGNYLITPEFQQYSQAKRDFINAILRQESGAVIGDQEFANADLQYFPQPGDDAKTIEQKRQNRENAIRGLEVVAGPGAQAVSGTNEQKPAGGTLKIGDVRDGYRYKGGNPNDQNSWEKVQ